MAQAVQITLTMDASGVVTVANSAGEAIKKIQPPSPGIKQEFDGIESAEKRAHIAGTLFAHVTGVEIPRALEGVIAKSQTLGPLLESAFSASIFAAAGAGIIGFAKTAIEGISSLSDEIMGNTAAVKKMHEENVQFSQDAFWNPKRLEDAQAHLKQINTEIGDLHSTIERLSQLPNADNAIPEMGVGTSPDVLDSQDRLNAAKEAQAQIEQHLNQLMQANKDLAAAALPIQLAGQAKVNEAGLTGIALISQQYRDQLQLIQAEQSAGGSAVIAAAKSQAAYGEYLNSTIALARDVAKQTMVLQDQTSENALVGIAKIRQQEADLIRQTLADDVEKLGLSQKEVQQTALYQAQIAKIHQDTSFKIMAFETQQDNHVKDLQNQATASALHGDDAIIASGQQRKEAEGRLWAAQREDDAHYNAAILAIDKDTQNKLVASHAETQRELGNLQEQQKDAESAIALSYVDDWQKSLAQTLVERDKQLRIIDQQERELLVQYAGNQDMIQQITETEQARRAAVWAQTDEKIRQEHKQMVEQLGADITSVFDDIASGNIGKRILQNAEKLFAEIIAQWLLSLNIMKTAFGGLLGNLVFGPGSTGANVFGGGNFLGNLFGTSSSNLVAGGSSGFAPSITGFSSTAGINLPGLTAGGGLAGAIAGTGSTPTFSASNALTTQSLASITGNSIGGGLSQGVTQASKPGFLGSLFNTQSLTALGGLGLSFAGSLGGKTGQIGGMLSTLAIMAAMNPTGPIASLLGHLGGVGGIAGTVLAAAGPALLGFGLGSNFGPLGGALVGGGSGFLAGGLIGLAGGPIGALVGGIVGLVGGLLGGIFGSSKRKRQAQDYANNTVVPDIKQITSQFDTFQLDSTSAMQQLETLSTDAQKQLDALKGEGKDVFKNIVNPAIGDAEKHVQSTETERERRAAIVFGAPQFHDGGVVDVMRASIRRQPDEMLAWLKHGERVMNPGASARHGRTLDAMNAGRGVGPNITLNIRALDVKDFDTYLRSGGMEAIISNINRALNEGQL